MRILQIIQKKQYRGAEIFASQLSNHFFDEGHVVEMVSIYDGDAILPFSRGIRSLSSNEYNRYFDLVGWRKLSEIISDFKPDVVQANAADTLKYVVFSKMIYKWKQPIFYRNASTSSFYVKSRFSKILNSFLLKNVDQIISVSEASKFDLNSLFPFTKFKTIVIPIGIETNNNKKFNLGDNRHNIIHVGSFTREKNHEGLILIFQEIRKSNSNCHLHLFGEGPLRNKIEKQVIEKGLQDYISFYEGVRNPLPYISGADILVLPSIIEGLPGVILEAMSCKTPVVAYNVGGISEILDNSTGSLIAPGDRLSFSASIFEALSNKNDVQIQSAYDLVTTKYLNSQLALKFVNSYEKLVPTLE